MKKLKEDEREMEKSGGIINKNEDSFNKIYRNISSLLDKDFEIPFNIDKTKINSKNFIFTDNAIKKLKEIKYYIMNKFPVLLEGPTGTAKTKSVEILCEEMGLKLRRFNLSSETKTSDLFGRYVGDPDSFSGIDFQEGIFIEAFKNGYTLLLDEINLASSQVLQAFEECLDSHKISCEIPGMPWQEIQMGKGFNLIATQNPNKGLFANKRQELGKKFLSRFHVINFDNFQKEELYEIAKGLGENTSPKISNEVLKELVDFHDEWSNLEERKNDILCFTVREIEATISAVSKGKNIKEAILSVYGSRYKSKEYEKLKLTLNKYPNLNKNYSNFKVTFKNEFLYMTPPLEKLLRSVKLSFENNRHIIIAGDEGTGKSQIAKYIASEYQNKSKKNDDKINDEEFYYCECTEDLKCSDLIGNQYPSLNLSSSEESQQLMKWEDGFLTLAIIQGKYCILDDIEEAPATITERLNGLLDKKLDIEKERIFEIPECPHRQQVEIDKNFRLICVCNYDNLSKMTPSFLNRFDIITLEDQIKSLYFKSRSELHYFDLIGKLLKQHSFNYQLNGEEKTNKKFDFSDNKNNDLIKLIYKKILTNIQKGDLSIYKLSLFCRAINIFKQEFSSTNDIKIEQLINYAYQLTISPTFEDDIIIEDFIYKKYLNYDLEKSIDDKYFFKDSQKLRSFMAKLFAASMINLHICLIGKTGIGKTSCAREFSRIRKKSMKLSKDFYMHSFHSNTKSSHFYGNIIIKNNEIEFINGSLLNAMEEGTTFIADEMNLSPKIVMKSIVPSLDLNFNCKIYIPGINKKIKINQKYFFIACQNDFTTTGRNSLPKLLAKKLKCIPYPEPSIKDLQKICSNINLELYPKYDELEKRQIIQNGEKIAQYMIELNKLKLSFIPNWSIRDVTKILKRVKFQKINHYKYININFTDNIVFYTLSGIYKKDIKDINIKNNLLQKIFIILKSVFYLLDNQIKDIQDIFNKDTELIKGKDAYYLHKGKCSISLKYIPFFNKNTNFFQLPSLYNELFQILLAHDEEPILLIGESGYKTYLAQLLLPDIKSIQLNSETTIGQLLGSTVFLSDSEVKAFYLKQIYNILDLPIKENEIQMVQNWVNKNENNQIEILKEQENLILQIDEEIEKKEAKIQKFKNTLKILKEKLICDNSEKKKHLNDINLEFKPGLILNSIFRGQSLILKYLSNLPTVVLERFNELFSGKHNLTLNEDIYNTFTNEENKEFSDLGENFRIFATCSLGQQNKLSEPVLSRFTIICSDKYKIEERKDVLNSFLLENKFDILLNKECINLIIRFSNEINKNSLSLMLNALSLSNQKELLKESEGISRLNILSFILYRIIYGLSYKVKSNQDNQFYDIEEKLKKLLPEFKGKIILGENINEEPLTISEVNGIKFIKSKYNNLQIEYGLYPEITKYDINDIAFTKTFTEMIDYIHFGIATNTPIILEGGTGLGKQTAINYIAHKLNYRIINFIITQSTKVEDLLGRNQIKRNNGQIKIEFSETKILKILIGKEGKIGDNTIIVIHNLNKASSSLMESLSSIFDKKQTKILRPDGRSETKSKFNLIGLINNQSNISFKDKLPLSLINNVFYYILPKLSSKEIKEIILKKFSYCNLNDEIIEFVDCFNKSREFSYSKGNISYFSLNDITKYILLRKVTKYYLDKSYIFQIIFAYRYIQNEFIVEIMKKLGFLSMKLNPIFQNRDDCLSISFKKGKNEILIPYYDKCQINRETIKEKINTLNLKQKQCLLFLVLSILCKRTCIIQGDTAAGKTHLIRLFAEMLGKKLIVFQINKETGLSIFTGQSTLQKYLEKEEIENVKKYFEVLSKNENLKIYLNINFSYELLTEEIIKEKWTLKQFNDLIKKIREYIKINNEDLDEEEYNEYKNIANNLENLIQPYKRLRKKESIFIEALEKGYWVLIDGIESANPVISDKLIRLCDENAELDLTETGENIVYSKSNQKIHQNFHLFINYNPLNKFSNNQLSEMFLNKCINFTLSSMDSDIESSAQIIYGFMKNSNKISESLCKQISSKVAKIHQEMNKKILVNQEFFSGGVEFTGRIIKYIGEELYKSEDENDLCKHLINAFHLNYLNSINNKNNIKNIIEIKNIIKENLKNTNINFITGESDIFIKYPEIFKILNNIQDVAKGNINNYDFSFINYLEWIKKVEISDLDLIYSYNDETLKILDIFVGESIEKKINYYNFYNLIIIQKLIKNVLDYVNNNQNYNLIDFSLNDEEELLSKSILTKEIAQINLVYKLELEMNKFNISKSYIYLSNELLEYISSIEKLLISNNIKDLHHHLEILKQCFEQKINITQIFPFNKIISEKKDNNNKRIRMFKIIFLIYKLIENRVSFQFSCKNNIDIIKFTFPNDNKATLNNLYVILNISNNFNFENSKILLNYLETSEIIFEIKEFINEEQIIHKTNLFYNFCLNILSKNISIKEKSDLTNILNSISDKNNIIIDKVTKKFIEEIKENNRTYSINKLILKQKQDFDKKEDNIIMKIWHLILFYDEDKLKQIIPYFCLPFEKELLQGIKYIYENIDINSINKIISFTKDIINNKIDDTQFSFGNSNTFLFSAHSGFLNYSDIESKHKKDYYLKIKNEMNLYYLIKQKYKIFYGYCFQNSIEFLENIYLKLRKDVEEQDIYEKYKNKLNELITLIHNSICEKKKYVKEKLINFLQKKLINPTKNEYEICKRITDNYLESLNEKPDKKIIFPFEKLNDFNEKDEYIICLNILKYYSIYHKKLTYILTKSNDILSDIFLLDSEIDIIYDIFNEYILEDEEKIKLYENKIMGIIRTLILYNIIKICNSEENNIEILFQKFLELPEIINDQIGGKGNKYFNINMLYWTNYNSDIDYFIIPKFEPIDFLNLFLIVIEDKEKEKPQFFPGLMLQNFKSSRLNSILSEFLKLNKQQQLLNNEEENNDFIRYIKKICISFLRIIFIDKYDENINKLSFMELKNKLENEEKNLDIKIKNLKKDKKPYNDEEINRQIIKQLLNCFVLVKVYCKKNYNIKLTYEDIDFFKNKIWNEELISTYPGMAFWLTKYYPSFYISLMDSIEKNEEIFIAEDNQISFWYFKIRIIANIQNFEFNCYDRKADILSKNKNKIEKYIKDKIQDLININQPVNINWLNLVLNYIPPELKFINQNLRHFYDFFALILSDSNGNQNEYKNEIILEYFILLLDLIFENKINEFFNVDLTNNEKDDLIQLINKPQDLLTKKIKERNLYYLQKNKFRLHIDNSLKILNHIKNDLPIIIRDINMIVIKKTKEYHDYYLKEGSKKLKNEIINIEQNLKKTKNDINKCLEVIKNKKLQEQKILEESINEFEKIMKNKNHYFNLSSKKEVIYYKLIIKAKLKNKKKYIIHIKNKNNKYEQIEFNYNCKNIYLQASMFNSEDIQDFFIFMKDENLIKLNIKNKVDIEQSSIYSFISPISFNDNAREIMIEDAKNSIKIYEPKITFNGNEFKLNKFDNFIKLIQNLELNKYDKKHKNKIILLLKEIDELEKYLHLETSNGRENDYLLEQKVKEFKNYISNLKDNLKLNLNDIENIICFNENIETNGIFLSNHDSQILIYKEPTQNKSIYISDNSVLNCPMISNNGISVIFSFKSFKMFIGSYIPSILSSPLMIKLLNVKKSKIKGFIQNSNTNIVTADDYVHENFYKIHINLQNLKPNKLLKSKINFELKLISEKYKEIIIPFHLTLNIVPLSIIFTCLDFKLIYDSARNIFSVDSPILYADTNIIFSFNYLYYSKNNNQLNDNIVSFDYSLDSLENNTSIKPKLVKDKNKLILKLPSYENDKNNIINFILNIYFTSTFFINIKFNSKIYPLNFNFEWYSYNKKAFSDEDILIYIDKDMIPYEYIIYLKFKTIPEIFVELYYSLPEGIKILNNDIIRMKIKNDFLIPLKLKIKKLPQNLKESNDYYIQVKGNQIDKKLYIKPKIINKKTNRLEQLLDLPKYEYSSKNNKFYKCPEKTELKKDSIYITPFNYYISYAKISYNLNTADAIKSIIKPKFILCYNIKEQIISKINYIEKIDSNLIGITGIFNDDIWYPIDKFELNKENIFESFKYIKYDLNNLNDAKAMIEKINKDNANWSLPKILLNLYSIYEYIPIIKSYYYKKKKDILAQFIEYLPTLVKNELKNELDVLNKDDLFEQYYPVIINNLIYIIFKIFKKKYLLIEKNNYTLYLTNLKLPENITEKIKEKTKEYFKINEKQFLNYYLNSNIKEIDINNKMEEGNNIFLLHENKNHEAKDKIEQISLEEEEIEIKETESEKIDLNDIKLEVQKPSKNSINGIIDYYINCNNLINILYFYIIDASKTNNEKNLLIAGNCFQKLESIYNKLKENDHNYSFFSTEINEFLKAFSNLKINCKYDKKEIKNNLNKNEGEKKYLIFPKLKPIYTMKDNWKTEKIEPKTSKIKKGEKIYLPLEKKIEKNININDKVFMEKIKILDIDDNVAENIYEDKEKENEPEEKNVKDETENKLKAGKISEKLTNINPVNINEKNFKEEDGIKRALKILEEEKKKKDKNILQEFDLGNQKKSHKFKISKDIDIPKNVELNIQPLYNKSNVLTNQLFIDINGKGKVKFSDTLVLLLIDPSVYISEEIKTLNMYIICAMANALNCLEIKYSIVLMGDEDFRCILKDYKEPHSVEALERVYECVMLKRFRTNIPGCLKYCLEEICSKCDFKFISFFIFTDGLDKRFINTQKNTWDTNIFYNKYYSFGFIFLLSSVLTNENKEFLKDIWNTFLKETKFNSHSSIYLKSLELKINQEFKNKLSDIFISTLSRAKDEKILNETKCIKPIFSVYKNENTISEFLEKNHKILDDKSLFKLNGSFIKNNTNSSPLNINKDSKEQIDINFYKNNLHQFAKIINSNNNKKNEINSINSFTQKFLGIKSNLNKSILEEIFKPNKANLKILSNTGTEIDIMALILYFLNPVPDPMIYLQDAIGNTKEYSITIILDTSFSVLNHININHSLNTIRVLLTSFTLIDLPSFDLIVTGEDGPIVLCSELPTFTALNEKSKLWELLFQCLSNPITNADLLSTLQTAFDLKRIRSNNFPSFLFVLTDGLYDEEKQKQIKDMIDKLNDINIQVIGIGLGIYPFGINNIFNQAIFDINPNNIFYSILNILEGNVNEKNKMDIYIQRKEEKEKDILITISKLIQNKNNLFEKLREELRLSQLTLNCYDMINEEISGGFDEQGNPINPKGDKIGLLRENSLQGQKILIVMLWSCALSEVENKLLDPKNIEQINEYNSKCIKNVVDYLGVTVKTVLNYEDAINEITKTDENGKCNYYTVWVMCGPEINRLPDNSKYPGLVEQFIDCLLLYWENGGAVALFCDNEPLYFQANMFLEKIRFNGDIKQTKLRITGNDLGTKILRGYEANGNLDNNSIYDTSTMRLSNGTERMPLGRNVPQIYEGETISHSNSNNIEDIKPFIPFAKNSSGNICIMIYSTQGKEGDIIIDCGYTKVFINMSTEDIATWRYVQNIAGFLARPEAHMIYDDGETAKNYRPKAVKFKIDKTNLYTKLKHHYIFGTGELDIVYMIDSTGSMGDWINGVKDKCKEISDKLNENEILKNYDIKFGGVFYRDPIDCLYDKHEYQPLGTVSELKEGMTYISAKGGGDEPEDWVGAYDLALDERMKWREDSLKIIIHIADAGAHTLRFTEDDYKHDLKKYEIGLVNNIRKCAQKNINIFGYQIGSSPKKSFTECKYIYDSVRSKDSFYEIYKFKHASAKAVAEKLLSSITNHISAFIAKKNN